MSTAIKNLLVGIFILSAIAILMALILFVKPTIGDGKQTLHVRFSDIGSLSVGTRVLFGGRPVGEVVAMEEIADARQQPTDELGRVYFYQLTLHIDSSVKVYNTDEISIQRSGLMGEKSIAITPKAPPKGVTPRQIAEQPVYANSVDSFESALLDFSDLSATVEETFQAVGDWVKTNGDQVAGTVQFAGMAMEGIGAAMEQLERGDTFRNAGSVMKHLKSATRSVDLACDDVAKGKGTLGRMIVDEDLYLQMNAILTKADHLMNAVNHYGLLFHLNKQWQRARLKRISSLNALTTPGHFQAYFQGEVDEINASMSRISMLVEKAKETPHREVLLSSFEFKRDFAQLLRKVNELSDNLRLYNQQFHASGSDG